MLNCSLLSDSRRMLADTGDLEFDVRKGFVECKGFFGEYGGSQPDSTTAKILDDLTKEYLVTKVQTPAATEACARTEELDIFVSHLFRRTTNNFSLNFKLFMKGGLDALHPFITRKV